MKRVIMICEGQTEQAFVKASLQPSFYSKEIILEAPLIKASKGGIVKWSTLKDEIERYLKYDPRAHVTTFIDYYGIDDKHGFPKWEDARAIVDKNKRMDFLEQAMWDDINLPDQKYRFMPYMQLHEFEGLLFNDINIIYEQIPAEDIVRRDELIRTFEEYGDNPEMINNNRKTSPSHRLMKIIQGYNKVLHGEILAKAIGLVRMRAKSPRFNSWIAKLEAL